MNLRFWLPLMIGPTALLGAFLPEGTRLAQAGSPLGVAIMVIAGLWGVAFWVGLGFLLGQRASPSEASKPAEAEPGVSRDRPALPDVFVVPTVMGPGWALHFDFLLGKGELYVDTKDQHVLELRSDVDRDTGVVYVRGCAWQWRPPFDRELISPERRREIIARVRKAYIAREREADLRDLELSAGLGDPARYEG